VDDAHADLPALGRVRRVAQEERRDRVREARREEGVALRQLELLVATAECGGVAGGDEAKRLGAAGDGLIIGGHGKGDVGELARVADEHVHRRGIRREVHDAQA
jgi:hypothetical protein